MDDEFHQFGGRFFFFLICLWFDLFSCPANSNVPSRQYFLSLIQRWEGTKYLLNTLLPYVVVSGNFLPLLSNPFLCLKDTNPVKSKIVQSNSLIAV